MIKKKIEYTINSCLDCIYIQSKFSGLCGHPKLLRQNLSRNIPSLLNIPLWCPLENVQEDI